MEETKFLKQFKQLKKFCKGSTVGIIARRTGLCSETVRRTFRLNPKSYQELTYNQMAVVDAAVDILQQSLDKQKKFEKMKLC